MRNEKSRVGALGGVSIAIGILALLVSLLALSRSAGNEENRV